MLLDVPVCGDDGWASVCSPSPTASWHIPRSTSRRDVENWSDTQEESSQHRTQFWLQVKAHYLAEQGIVIGRMSCKLQSKVTAHCKEWSNVQNKLL